ncbi:hypothetical protein GRF29_216g1062024, partial [Pseudopithomyces chartarum]
MSRYPSPPAEPQDPAPYISQALNDALDSPVTQHVYNLAATLTTTQHDDADADTDHDHDHDHDHDQDHDQDHDHDRDRDRNLDLDSQLRSLRANLDEHTQALSQIGVHLGHHDANLDRHQARLERSRDRLRTLERERSELEHRDRTDRLRRVMNRLGRLHNDNQSAEPRSQAYGDRVPNRNSLYDWSPANDEADDEAELEGILQELRREQPNTHPDVLRLLGRSQLDSERERSRAQVSRLLNTSQPSQTESSLRSAALLQSVRRNPRFAARSRDFQQRYADREATRSPHPSDWRDRTYESTRQAMERLSQQRRETIRDRDMLQRVDSYRRSYLDRTQAASAQVNPMVEQTIKYLSKIRQSQSIDDSLNHAIDAGFLGKEYFVDDYHDFVLDPFTLPPPAETSWLAPGAVLSGCQHATHVASTTTLASGPYRSPHPASRPAVPSLTDPLLDWRTSSRDNLFWDEPIVNLPPAPPEVVTTHSSHQDRWPVKVTIHSVDYTLMTLTATMEAYNVPSHPHSHQSLLSSSSIPEPYTRTSSITTYLEGEIIDFNTHTLLTESFNSSPATDATYWRKLTVFKDMSDEEV